MSTFLLLSGITVALSLMLAWYIWSRMNKSKNHTYFVFLMLSIVVWTIFAALEVIADTKAGKILYSQLSYLGIVSTPVFWLFFSMEYSEKYQWLQKKWIKLVWIVPLVTLLIAFTNGWHGLMWPKVYYTGMYDGIYIYKYERGMWFSINSFYIYSLFLSGFVIIFRKLKQKKNLGSYFTVIAGAIAPAAVNGLYLMRVLQLDYAPAAFSFTSYCFAWAIINGFLERKMAIADIIHDNMEEGIILVDKCYMIISINPSAARIINQKDITAGVDIRNAVFLWSELKDGFLEDTNEYYEITTGEGDARKWYGIHLYSIKNNKRISGWIINLFDITENKQNEEALRRMDQEARRTAEAANTAKSYFLANMSHEIRTPMNGIIGFADVLSETSLTRDQQDYLNEIKNGSEALLYLINDILDFSKIEADKMELENIDFNLHRLLENSISLVVPGAYSKGIELHSVIQNGVPAMVKGDPARMRQVFNNLLSNSLKFTEKGDIALTAGLIGEDVDSVTLEIKVSDSGIGMTEEVMKNLFMPFTQADSSTTRKFGGTGLGLAICKRIVEKMGGKITIDSKVNQGTTFKLTVKLQKSYSVDSEYTNYSNVKDLKVVVIDDSSLDRRIFREYLEGAGCMVLDAADFRQALETLKASSRQKPVDIVILDMTMPELEGIPFVKMMAEAGLQHMPEVIAASPAVRRNDYSKTSIGGYSGYISKPVRKEELLEAVLQVSEGRKSDTGQLPVQAKPLTMNDRKGKTVLLAEDMEANRKLATVLLKKMGYTIEVAVNGMEAAEVCKVKKFDLILMDCQMPLMDGYEASGSIKKAGGMNSGTPIIAMTANALEDDREKCLRAGMDDYIPKPVTSKLLQETLSKWVKLY